jgi:hypothetical protein
MLKMFFPNDLSTPCVLMGIVEEKRAWVDARVDEIRASGLKDAAIARRMGITPSWFHEAMAKPRVGDTFIERLCTAFGIRYTPNETYSGQLPNTSMVAETGPEHPEATKEETLSDRIHRLEKTMLSVHSVLLDVLKAMDRISGH